MKSYLQSKTFWFGVLTFVGGGVIAIQSVYPNVGYLAMVSGLIQIGLRFLTTEPVK